MPVDHIRYDILAQEALRGLVRKVLADAAKNGLPGEHHFYITFDTTADGVQLSPRLRQQYPDTMTVVMQHQFWDMKVTEAAFEVGMSFGGIAERLVIPFDAISAFADPSVQFGLQFEQLAEAGDETAEPAPTQARPRKPARHAPRPAEPTPAAANPADAPEPEPAPDRPSGDVVRLDRFRKK